MFCKKGVPKNLTKFTGKHLCLSLFFNKVLAKVFSCEFYEIFKNNFFSRTLPVAASKTHVALHLEVTRHVFLHFTVSIRSKCSTKTTSNSCQIQHASRHLEWKEVVLKLTRIFEARS